MTNEKIFQTRDDSLRTYLSYRIRMKTTDLEPSWLTNTIGINPSWKFTAGEKYLTRRPDGNGGWKEGTDIRPLSVWGLTTEKALDSNNLNQHCAYLATILEPKRSVLRELIDKTELFDIGLLLRVETANDIFSDTINSKPFSLLIELSHFIDISTIFIGDSTVS